MHDGTGVDELQWREAMQRAGGEGNAKTLWPVLALGTRDLLARKQAQVLHPSQTHGQFPRDGVLMLPARRSSGAPTP